MVRAFYLGPFPMPFELFCFGKILINLALSVTKTISAILIQKNYTFGTQNQ
jgi:hypothetical protein